MAQAILLQPVETLGERGEIVDVSPGYLRNYLVPAQARAAGHRGRRGRRPARQEAAERAVREAAEKAAENAEILGKTVLTLRQAAGADGRLFGSVTSQDIVDAIKQARGLKIDKRRVHLDEPIKTAGTHMVTVEVHDGVTTQIKTIVTPG